MLQCGSLQAVLFGGLVPSAEFDSVGGERTLHESGASAELNGPP